MRQIQLSWKFLGLLVLLVALGAILRECDDPLSTANVSQAIERLRANLQPRELP